MRKEAHASSLWIPLPALEVVSPVFPLPEAGAHSATPRVLSAEYAGRSLRLMLEAPAGTEVDYELVAGAKVHPAVVTESGAGVATLLPSAHGASRLHAAFAAGSGWQRMQVTLGW